MAHITKRKHKDGSFAYTIKVHRGRDPETGKQLKPYISTWSAPATWSEKKADKEAEKQAVIFEQECKSGAVAIDKQTFYEYSGYALDVKETQGLKYATLRNYRNSREKVKPYIGHYKIGEITTPMLNKLYKQLLELPNRKDPTKKVSAKYVLEDHRFISAVFSLAIQEGSLRINPAQNAQKPVVRKKQAQYYEDSEVIAIREALEPAPLKWKVYTHLLLVTGARRGEIAGLKWDKVDFEHNTISIAETLLYESGKGVYVETTKEDNPHVIKLPDVTMQLLKHYRSWYNVEKLKNGDRWQDTGYVFVQDNGLPMHPTSITGWLSKFAKKHPELPHLNPHAFRHSQASLLIFANVDIVTVSKRLGHKQVSTTQNIYAHVIQEADERAADCIADVIFGDNSKRKNKSS